MKEENISQTLFYSYLPSFHDYHEIDVEIQEKQVVSFLANIDHPFHEISKPTYDYYPMEFEEDIKENFQEKNLVEMLGVSESILHIFPISFSDYHKDKIEIINEAVKVEKSKNVPILLD